MRLVFMGSPVFALATLQALLDGGHQIVCVYSQPPKPAGRGKTVRMTPVHAFAQQLGLEVRTPVSLKSDEAKAEFAALDCDAAVVVAYGLILPKAILDAPKLGCFNLHGSLLPRWRGAAPIQRAIEAGDAVTGVQVMAMQTGLDTGAIYATASTPIAPDDTSATVHDRLAALGAQLMADALPKIGDATLMPIPQSEHGITYAAKIDRAETRIDWTLDAATIDAKVRAFSPSPGAWCHLPDGARAKILMTSLGQLQGPAGRVLDDNLLIGCGEGSVRILSLQREGKSVVSATEFLRGTHVDVGAQFG
jgi:methionyl-tRNA formyltransferase